MKTHPLEQATTSFFSLSASKIFKYKLKLLKATNNNILFLKKKKNPVS